jgi:hypothetical protein
LHEVPSDRCQEPLTPAEDDGGTATPAPRYRPICFLGQAGYAFNAPPGLNYLKEEHIHFRLDPTATALEAKEVVEGLGLRGAVEAGTERWSRCMEAELVETTIDSALRARPAERHRLKIHTPWWRRRSQKPVLGSGTRD